MGGSVDEQLRQIYYQPESTGALGGIDRLHRAAKQQFTRKEIQEWLSKQDVYTLHKPVRLKFSRRRTLVSHIDDVWQMDLVDMKAYKQDNAGYTFLLTCIDVFSKFAWVHPLKDKTGMTVLKAIQKIFKQGRKPKKIQTDYGSEFINKNVRAFLDKSNVGYYTTYSETKASVVERFNRTLKSRMWRYFTHRGNHKYIDILPRLVKGYNSSYHRSIGRAPETVSPSNVKEVHKTLFPSHKKTYASLGLGDKVRISKTRRTFDKGYLPNWTDEVFTISRVLDKQPPVYNLSDLGGNAIKGMFYPQELQKILKSDDDLWRIERIVRKKGNKYLVKWAGYNDQYNSWVNAADLVHLEDASTR